MQLKGAFALVFFAVILRLAQKGRMPIPYIT